MKENALQDQPDSKVSFSYVGAHPCCGPDGKMIHSFSASSVHFHSLFWVHSFSNTAPQCMWKHFVQLMVNVCLEQVQRCRSWASWHHASMQNFCGWKSEDVGLKTSRGKYCTTSCRERDWAKLRENYTACRAGAPHQRNQGHRLRKFVD